MVALCTHESLMEHFDVAVTIVDENDRSQTLAGASAVLVTCSQEHQLETLVTAVCHAARHPGVG